MGMDIRAWILAEWAAPEIPLPILLIGPGSTQIISDLTASRVRSLYLDSTLTVANIEELERWLANRHQGWIGIGLALDRIISDRVTARFLDRWLVNTVGLAGLAMSWERSGSLDDVWTRCSRTGRVFRLVAEPVGPIGLGPGVAADVARAGVVNVLAGLARKDHELLERLLSSWGALEIAALRIWMQEAITGQWSEFSIADSSSFHTNKKFLMTLMKTIDSDMNPRILAKSLFLPMVL